MTPQRAKELLPIITAYAEGKTIQGKNRHDEWEDLHSPGFGGPDLSRYRIKPEPVTRPWSKPEDVPGPVCWIRGRSGSGVNDVQRLVMCVHQVTVTHAPGGPHHNVTFDELAKDWEHSTDRKTWHPCTVTEEA